MRLCRALGLTAALFSAAFSVAQSSEFVQAPWVQLGDQSAYGRNSLAIVWQSPDKDAEYKLEYKQGGTAKQAALSFRTVAVGKIEPHRVYSAVLKDLKAGQPIQYQVLKDGKSIFSGSTTAPKSAKQSVRFAIFGDCGAGTKEEAAIAFQTYNAKPDFLLLTGDIVYSKGLISEYRKNFFPYYNLDTPSITTGAPLLRSTLTIGVPGNHDIDGKELGATPDGLAYFMYYTQPLNGPIGEVNAENTPKISGPDEAQQAFLKAAGPNYPRLANFSFDYGNAHWLLLDSNPYVNWSDPKLQAWIADDLKKAAKSKWRFVAFHHPPFNSSKKHAGDKQMRPLASVFEDGKVDVVFMGHVHNYQRTFPIQVGSKRGAPQDQLNMNDWPIDKSFDGVKNTRPKGVVYIVDGAGGAHLYNPEQEAAPGTWLPFTDKYLVKHSVSIVELSGNRFVLRQIDTAGREIDHFSITK